MDNKFSLTSPAFAAGGDIPVIYTSDGEGISPPLTIRGIPKGTKSLVLILDDPDAATDPDGPGKIFDHWVVFNIPPEISEVSAGKAPLGATQASNGINQPKYIGPAPPNGKHRYFFKLYALSDVLKLNSSSTKPEVEQAMSGKVIDQTELIGKYQR